MRQLLQAAETARASIRGRTKQFLSLLLFCNYRPTVCVAATNEWHQWPRIIVRCMALLVREYTMNTATAVTRTLTVTMCILLQCDGNRNKCSAVAEMGDRLATIDMGRKLGGYVPFGAAGVDRHVTQCRLGRGLPSYQVACLDPSSRLATINMGRKVGGGCAPF